jgi:hypothetical protein
MKAQPNQWPLVVEGALQGHVLMQARKEARHMKEQGTQGTLKAYWRLEGSSAGRGERLGGIPSSHAPENVYHPRAC